MIKFDVNNRFSGAVQFTAEIDCEERRSRAWKLRLAVLWAISHKITFSYSNLSGSDLSYSNLSYSNLSGSDLSYSNLSYSNLRGSDLSGSDLRGSDLSGSDLRGSDLSGSNLSYSNLSGSDLSGSDLSYSNLRGSDLRGDKVRRLIGSANRSDGYTFYAYELDAGGWKVLAGCRWFSEAEYRAHILREYASTAKAIETGDILDFLAKRAAA